MKGYRREDRVSELLLEEISSIVLRELKDPRVKGITITHVQISADLQHARVFYISTFSSSQDVEKGLYSSAGFIRRELKKRLRLKYIPELKFIYDDSFDYGNKIDQILKDLKGDDSE